MEVSFLWSRVLSREKDVWQDVGPFKGVDLFSDGSFFLLDTPGVSSITLTPFLVIHPSLLTDQMLTLLSFAASPRQYHRLDLGRYRLEDGRQGKGRKV